MVLRSHTLVTVWNGFRNGTHKHKPLRATTAGYKIVAHHHHHRCWAPKEKLELNQHQLPPIKSANCRLAVVATVGVATPGDANFIDLFTPAQWWRFCHGPAFLLNLICRASPAKCRRSDSSHSHRRWKLSWLMICGHRAGTTETIVLVYSNPRGKNLRQFDARLCRMAVGNVLFCCFLSCVLTLHSQ